MHFGQWKGAVVPGYPPFDKIAALCLLIHRITGLLEWPQGLRLEYWRSNQEPDPATKTRWSQEQLYPIDIGSNKYHMRRLGSACEVVATDLEIPLEQHRRLAWLVRLANDNNSSGFLKALSFQKNMPWTVRELYKAQKFVPTETAIEAGAHVIFSELKYRMLSQSKYARNFPEVRKYPELVKLMEQLPPLTEEPFTFTHYLRCMFVIGVEVGEIHRRMQFWMTNFAKAQKLNVQAVDEAARREKDEFTVCERRCLHIKTDNDRLARALFTEKDAPAIILVEKSNKTFVILSNRKFHEFQHFKASMWTLAETLASLEDSGGSWFFDDRIGALMGGSRSLSRSNASSLGAEKIKEQIMDIVRLPRTENEERGLFCGILSSNKGRIPQSRL